MPHRAAPSMLNGKQHKSGCGAPVEEKMQNAIREDRTPDAGELMRWATDFIPTLRERTNQGARENRIPAETIEEMRKAGLFRVLQPRRYGGYEMDVQTFYDIQIALARGDMSTGWVYGVVGVHPWQLALFPDEAQRDVWGKNSDNLIASSYMQGGKAVRTNGGFLLSGRWRFSSGVEHCQWVFLGGLAPQEGVQQTADPTKFTAETAPDARTFLLPLADCKIVKTWDVSGLRGTGSQDVIVENAFVPEYRTHKMSDGNSCSSPGNAVNKSPLYKMPFAQVFNRAVSTACLGALEGMLDVFREHAKVRVSLLGSKTANDPEAQLACAETAAEIFEMKLVLRDSVENLMSYARKGEQPPAADRMRYKFQSAKVSDRCSRLATRLFKSAGASALFNTALFGGILADILAGGQHVASQFGPYGRAWGGTMLGVPNTDAWL